MSRIRLSAALAGIMCALAATAGYADTQGDPERGATLAYTCAGCHGIPGYKNVYPTYSVPKIGGQSRGYLVSALHAYRAGERRHTTMNAQTANLTDQDILDIAAYFVSLTEEE